MDSKRRLAIYLIFVLGISVFLFGFVSLSSNHFFKGKFTGKPTAALASADNTATDSEGGSSSTSCNDPDGSFGYFVRSTVTNSSDSHRDFCTNNTYVKEYSCGFHSDKIISRNHACPFGCSNGACIKCYDTAINDSDPSVKVADESCSSDGKLSEAHCKSNSEVEYVLEDCPSDTVCSGGVCKLDNSNEENNTSTGDNNTSTGDNNTTKCVPNWQYMNCSSYEIGIWNDSNNCGYNHEFTGCDSNNNSIMWSSAVSLFNESDILIGGEVFNNSIDYTGIGSKIVDLNYKDNKIQFEWDFSKPLNLQQVNIIGASSGADWNYIIISNLSVSDKTIFINRLNNESSNSVCIIDENNVLPSDFSGYCNETNEILVPCQEGSNETTNRYNCELLNNGTEFKVWPLSHSAVAEWFTKTDKRAICSSSLEYGAWSDCSCTNCDNGVQYRNVTDLNNCLPDYVENQSCGGECMPNWDCPNWENISCVNGEKTRVCTDLNSCGIEEGKPSETLPCTAKKKKNSLSLVLIILGGIILVSLALYILMSKRDKEASNVSQENNSPKPPVSPNTGVYTPNNVR